MGAVHGQRNRRGGSRGAHWGALGASHDPLIPFHAGGGQIRRAEAAGGRPSAVARGLRRRGHTPAMPPPPPVSPFRSDVLAGKV